MAYELVGSGGILDAAELSQYEASLAEGQRGLLELDLRLPVSASVAAQLENELRQRGVLDVSVSTASPMLRVSWRKGFPWLAVIAAVVLGLVILAILIIGWRIFREVVPKGLQPLVGTGLIVAGIALVGLIVLRRRK